MYSQFMQILTNLEQPPAQIGPSGLAMFLVYDFFYAMSTGWMPLFAGEHNVMYLPGVGQPQTWLWGTYNDGTCHDSNNKVQDCWNQDVESFSHEAAEWADDPFGQNPQPCGEHLEVADPLSSFLFHYYTYKGANGLPYTLQDLVFLPYFGAPAGTSYNGQTTFQNYPLPYCG